MATIAEFSSGFPGISTRIPFENGFISEVLVEHGYNTYCVGKWHLTPGEETGMAAWKRRWPLGRGFERFYGFLGGESSCWYPDLIHDNHPVDPPATPEEGYHIAKDLSDQAIRFIRDAKVVEPDKPFFMYFSLDAAHAPHHVFKEWADKYKGRFDEGYEAIRAEILARQKELGLLPEDTELSGINPHGEPAATGPDGQPWPMLDTVRPWDSLSDDEKRLFARMAEVFAGYVEYTDDQVGRVIDFLESSGRARQHDHRRRLRQRCERRGRPERHVQRVALLQRRTHADRADTASTSTSSAARRATTTTTPVGPGRSTPRSPTGSGGPATRAASPTCAWSRGRRRWRRSKTPRQQYVHAVDVVPTIYDLHRHHPAGNAQRLRAEPDRG